MKSELGDPQYDKRRAMLRAGAGGAVIGAVGSVVVTQLGVPIWIALPLFVAVALSVTIRLRARIMRAVPVGDVACPRCGLQPRTSSGWCPPCTAALDASPVAADHPMARLAAAFVSDDDKVVAGSVELMAPKVTLQLANGTTNVIKREAWLRSLRLGLKLYRDRHSRLVSLHADPGVADVFWTHTRDSAKGRLVLPDLDVELTTRYRLTHGLVSEVVMYPALPARA